MLSGKTCRINLTGSVGLGPIDGGQLYGPGENVLVPLELAKALGLAGEDAAYRTVQAVDTGEEYGIEFGDDFPEAEVLREAGYTTTEAVQDASDEELLALEGIGPSKLRQIRAAA